MTGPTDRVVVVGAGLGGLACALHLAGAGRRVTVLERAAEPGGRAGRLALDGYEFDTGPTVLTMPELIDRTFAAVGEAPADWLDLVPAGSGLPGALPRRLPLDVIADTGRMAGEVTEVCGPREADGYLRFVDYTRRLWRLQRADFIERNFDRPRDLLSANLLRLVAAGGFGRLAAPDRPVLPRPPHPADLLFPGDVRRPRPAPGARALRGHPLPGLGRRGLLPARRACTRCRGRWPAPPRSTGCEIRYGTEVTRVESRRRPGARRCITADGERIAGRRGGAQPRPAGRLPGPAARAGRRGGGCATRPPAWSCTSARRSAYAQDRPPQHPLWAGLAGAPSTRSSGAAG